MRYPSDCSAFIQECRCYVLFMPSDDCLMLVVCGYDGPFPTDKVQVGEVPLLASSR